MTAEIDQLRSSSTVMQALADIYDGESDTRLGTDMLILRLPVDQRWDQALVNAVQTKRMTKKVKSWLGAEDMATAFQRAEDRPVYLLGFNAGDVVLTKNINPKYRYDVLAAARINTAEALIQIRQAEMDHLLHQSRALLTSANNTVFRAPSGRLVRHFIRVGNIQYNREAIDAVSFWLLPHMCKAAAILTDTWSISSIALNTARIAAIQFGGDACPVELLPDYLEISEASKVRAGKIVTQLVREAPVTAERSEVLCLVSATQSGSLQKRLDAVAREPLGTLLPKFVAIFALGSTGMASLRDLSGDKRFELLPDDVGADTARPVPIDPKVYFPLEFHDLEYELKKGEADAAKEVMDALARKGSLRLHCDVSKLGRTRHHGVHIATERLLEIPLFRERLEAATAVVTAAPLVVVAPPLPGSMAIAEFIVERLQGRGLETQLSLHPNLFFKESEMGQDDIALRDRIRSASRADSIVVVTDAWINDASLSQYQRFLRTEGYKGRIHYIAGVARPPDTRSWTRSARRLRYRDHGDQHTVTSGFELPLPDWTEKDCSWCAELRLYQRWSNRRALPELLKRRRDELVGVRATGLSDAFALALPDLPQMRLGPESFYVQQDSSQVDAFVGVSSALQRLRSDFSPEKPPLGPRHFPTATVLKSGDYLVETWTDSVLRAVFLRAATLDELAYTAPHSEATRTEQLRTILMDSSPGIHDVALEILLAAALGKADIEIDDHLRQKLAELGASEVVGYMLDMIEQDHAPPEAEETLAEAEESK